MTQTDPPGVRVFRAGYRPRALGAALTAACSGLLLAPLLHGPLPGPAPLGVRLGIGLAMWVACARLFQKQGAHRLEVGPAGLTMIQGRSPHSFPWDAFDTFASPSPGALVLRTKAQQLVTLQGWSQPEVMVPLVLQHLEKQLGGPRSGAPASLH